MNDRIHILCYGNSLHGDDAFGPSVYQALQELELGNHITCFDAGIAGLNSLSLYENCDQVLIIDACIGLGNIGELHYFSLEQYLSLFDDQNPVHDFDLNYLLHALPTTLKQSIPKIELLCVEITSVQTFQSSISPEIKTAIFNATDWILEHLKIQLTDLNSSEKPTVLCY